jgi:transposase
MWHDPVVHARHFAEPYAEPMNYQPLVARAYRCSACGLVRVTSRGQVERRFVSLPIGGRGTIVIFAIPRVKCQACELVHQVKISFAGARCSYTKPFERYAVQLSRRMTIFDEARHLNIGWDLIKGFQNRDLSRRYAKPKEGTNNKINTVKRLAYGFRDTEFFKLEILAIHETRHQLVG